jgi:hypothetical protein
VQTAFYRALEQANRAIGSAADPTAAAHAVADQFATAAKARETWACQQGCAHCCRFPVGVTVTEALRLGEALRLAPVAERQRLLRTIEAEARESAAVSWLELAGRPCPLLHRGACSLYAARPVPCRSLGSADATACERAADGDAVPVPLSDDSFAAGLAVGQALDARTGAHGHRELRAALYAVLTAADDARTVAFIAARPAGGDAQAAAAPRCGPG